MFHNNFSVSFPVLEFGQAHLEYHGLKKMAVPTESKLGLCSFFPLRVVSNLPAVRMSSHCNWKTKIDKEKSEKKMGNLK